MFSICGPAGYSAPRPVFFAHFRQNWFSTRAYNARMKELLPQAGIELIEIERKDGISASKVRALMQAGDLAGVRALVPDTTYAYIKDHLG